MHSSIPPSNQIVYINEYSEYSFHMQKKHTSGVHCKKRWKRQRRSGRSRNSSLCESATVRPPKYPLLQQKFWGVIQRELIKVAICVSCRKESWQPGHSATAVLSLLISQLPILGTLHNHSSAPRRLATTPSLNTGPLLVFGFMTS